MVVLKKKTVEIKKVYKVGMKRSGSRGMGKSKSSSTILLRSAEEGEDTSREERELTPDET